MQNLNFNTILCFGEVLWDVLPTGAKPGGAPLNVAIHLNKMKIHPLLISKTGNDREGEDLKEFLISAGLATDFIGTDISLPTSKVLVKLDEQKNATYEICEPVAWDNILLTGSMGKAAAAADLIVYGTLASRNKTTRETLFHLLEISSAVRLLDVNLRPPYNQQENVEQLLHKSDFVKLNDDELRTIASWHVEPGTETELIHWISDFYHCKIVCVTRGAKGAMLLFENQVYEHPGFAVDAVDTVGAGDSFLAALIAGLDNKIAR